MGWSAIEEELVRYKINGNWNTFHIKELGYRTCLFEYKAVLVLSVPYTCAL
jgi:hypothetical protein